MTDPLRSGQVAAAAGVNQQTLRYYERRGLISEPDRTLGGHRLYPPETVTVLRVIKTAQRLGFTLEEVADLLAAGTHRHGRRADAGLLSLAESKLTEVEQKIADLGIIRDTLRAAVRPAATTSSPAPRATAVRCPSPSSPAGPTVPNLIRADSADRTDRAGGVACAACCAVPLLVAAGVLGGAGWAAFGRLLPGISVVLAVAAGGAWWWASRRRHRSGCAARRLLLRHPTGRD